MFRSKSDIDKHVFGLLYRAKTEEERNLRCFHIAKLYYKVQDYESVQRYINMYLSSRDDSAAAHKLLGQALEGLGQKDKAITAYTKSLKLESDQSDLVSKVCELLCDKDVEFDPVLARYWCERASSLFPHSLPVFTLKEKLMTADSSISSKDLEELLHAELKAKPTDVSVRIKLLKMYAESGRSEMAINHAFDVEARQAHVNCFAWYQCLNNICKAYNRDHFAKCGWEFYIQWLCALDRLCLLSVTENMYYSCDLSEAVECVYSLDQAIYFASLCPTKVDKFEDFIKIMSAQLAYLLGIILLKKAKQDNSQWKEIKRLVGPLFIIAVNSPLKIDQSWTSSLKENIRKLLEYWMNQVHSRQVQSGHLLLFLVKENHTEKMFIDKISHMTAGDWRKPIFERVFSTISDQKQSTSHFMIGKEFVKFPLKIPPSSVLKPTSFVPFFENTYYGSLHHLVWLGLRCVKKTSILEMKLHSFRSTRFKNLQFTINNLNNIGVETINQLDIDSFLYTTVFCTASILEENKSNVISNEERPQILPADVSSPLCSGEQAKWWSNLCTLVNGGMPLQTKSNESMSDVRFTLQRGLEVVRGEGLSPILIVALARTFSSRGSSSSTTEESAGCFARSLHLWQIAYPVLERLAANKSCFSNCKVNPLFEYPMKVISSQEAKLLFDEAKFHIGCHYQNTGQFEKAVDELKGIKSSPQATFHLGQVYQKWAEQQLDGMKGEEITSDIRCRHTILATKARDYLYEAKHMLKNDVTNPLRGDIDFHLSEVEDLLSRIEPENGALGRDVNGASDKSPSYGSGDSPDVIHILNSANQRSVRHQTSTPHRTHEQKANRFNMSELIELLSVQQSTNQLKMQQVLEQIRLLTEKFDNLSSEQRSQRHIVEGLMSRLIVFESEMKNNLTELKKDIKRPEFGNMFDEDDYTEEMLQYPGYSQYYGPTQRVVPNTAAPANVPYVNQFFSPRIDPLCQTFYTQQGALPFSEGQQLPDFLRQPKVNQPLLHPIPPGIPPPLNLATALPGPSRVPTGAIPPNVLLTTADTLTSATIPVPQLSVNIPTIQRPSIPPNVAHNFQIPLPPQPKPTLTIEERPIEEETPPPTYDPLPDYKPIVPLPDEVEVHTGEEEEEILFERKAKLFRYNDKAWKERGSGTLKILKNKITGKVRILMRRDQVHKICANHFLTPDMDLQPKAKTENAWIWVANDFADEKVELEKFCAKFNKEDSEEFKHAFEKAKEDLEAVRDTSSSEPPPPPLNLSENKSSLPSLGFSVSSTSNVSSSTLSSTPMAQSSVSSSAGASNLFSNTSSSTLNTFPSSSSGLFESTARTSVFGSISNTSNLFSTPSSTSSYSFTTSPKTSITFSNLPSTTSNIFTNSSSTNTGTNLFSSGSSFKFTPAQWGNVSNKPQATDNDESLKKTEKAQETDKSAETVKSFNQTSVQPAKLGGFTFSLAAPKFKAPEAPKEEQAATTKEPSPIVKFNLGLSTDPPKTSFSAFSNLGSQTKTELPNPFAISSSAKSSHVTVDDPKEENGTKFSDKNDAAKSSKDEEDVDNFVPTATYQPVIPLPDLVAVKTGEENEEVIFEDRAQLYRFCRTDKAWKERGTGQMKILRHPETDSYRLLMRREQVLKVCCNHRITNDIKLKPINTSDRAFSWAAKDHSEEEATDELFSIKFKKIEQAHKFKQEFEKAQSNLSSSQPPSNVKMNEKPPLSSLIKKAPGSWECKGCYLSNKADAVKCISCESPAPKKEGLSLSSSNSSTKAAVPEVKKDSQLSLSELMKPKAGSWECDDCYVRNDSGSITCVSCGKTKPGAVTTSSESSVIKGSDGGNPFTSFTFGIPKTDTTQNVPVGFATSAPTSFSFEIPSTQKPLSNDKKGDSFTFGDGGFNFAPPKSTTNEPSVTPVNTPGIPGYAFSSPKSDSNTAFKFGSASFQFAMNPPKVSGSPGTNTSQHDESGGYDPEEEEEENRVQFQPVVPLPDKIEVVTGEENENVLYSERAKLFRYDDKEWKERGLGNIKILQHKESGKVRLLMRREPIMKVCLNHVLTPDITFKKKDDKAWLWAAVDFSEGTQKNENFAIRFKSLDIAQTFKKKIDEAKSLPESSPSSALIHGEKSEGIKKDAAYESKSSSDNDVEFVSEQTASPELVAKALALQLPPNYYCYLKKPKCSGCQGCEPDTEDENENAEETSKKSTTLLKASEDKGPNVLSKESIHIQPTSLAANAKETERKFSFSQAFNNPSKDDKASTFTQPEGSQKGFFYDPTSFYPTTPQKNIFTSGVTQETPAFLSDTSSLESFSNLSKGGQALSVAGENFRWEGAGNPVFGGQKKEQRKKNDSENPLPVPLPGKSGFMAQEKDLDHVFSGKGTLKSFANDKKDEKESGIGVLKILFHKERNINILFMRSESDQKIICNNLINKDFNVVPDEDSSWRAKNYSKEKPVFEKLSIKFFNSEDIVRFKKAIGQCKKTDK